MKLILASVFCIIVPAISAAEPTPAASYPPHVLSNTELRVLPRTRADRLYQLHIALPSGFREHPEKKYPVVFVTDAYWDFTTVVAAYSNLSYTKNVPEMLIVGLGYAGKNVDYNLIRGDDLSPMAVQGWDADGSAAQFLQMIETVAIPLLEKEYQADPLHRYLMGCSAGGMFALYTALTKPDLFQGYVADSPAVLFLWPYERASAVAHRKIAGRVFISAGANEWKMYRQQISGFSRRLQSDDLVTGGLKFQELENLRHGGGKPISYTQGLLFVTDPIAPERGVSTDWMTDPQDRPAFVASFWLKPSETAETSTEAIRLHEAYWAQLLSEGKAYLTAGTPGGVTPRGWAETFFSTDRSAAEALVREDPAVKSGSLAYELIEVTQ